MTDSISSKPNKSADRDDDRKVYIQRSALRKQQSQYTADARSGTPPVKVAGISPDAVVYVDRPSPATAQRPPETQPVQTPHIASEQAIRRDISLIVPQDVIAAGSVKVLRPAQDTRANIVQNPRSAQSALANSGQIPLPLNPVRNVGEDNGRRRSVRESGRSYYPRMLTQKQRKAAKKASAIRGIAVGAGFIGLCAVLTFTGAAESILFPYTQTLQAEQLGHDSYNTAFEFITYEFPVEISVGSQVSYTLLSSGSTVQDALEDAGIVLGELDSTSLPLDHVMTDTDQIDIDVVDVRTRTEERYVPYGTKTVDSQTVPKGTTRVVSKGKNGVVTDTYECRYVNGELTEETLVSSAETSQPVDEVVYRGVGGVFTAPDGTKYSYSYYVDVSATAYGDVSEGTNPNWHGITAIGEKVRPGIIGVDPDVIPFRSNVYVIGDFGDFGVCYAADTGLAKGNILDIYMETYAEMVRFGRRDMRAYVLE